MKKKLSQVIALFGERGANGGRRNRDGCVVKGEEADNGDAEYDEVQMSTWRNARYFRPEYLSS